MRVELFVSGIVTYGSSVAVNLRSFLIVETIQVLPQVEHPEHVVAAGQLLPVPRVVVRWISG